MDQIVKYRWRHRTCE